jgi:UDP-N-acetylglucosamine--N-acetylmuramyl-(pentapeptide) pyrophosphoryl-undecaprenol N-acetylglucosamine transferase
LREEKNYNITHIFMKILFTGGGTSGHITPLLAVAEEIKKIKSAEEKLEFMFIGPDSDFNKAISDAGIEVKNIQAGKLRRYFSLKNFTDIFKIIYGVAQSFYFVYIFKPDIVFSKGGFASVPAVIAARIFNILIFTHESDISPGLANRIISFFADKIFISFEDTGEYFSKRKTIYAGSLIREHILAGDKNRAKSFFGLKENIPTILVFGGSQGAQKINEILLKLLPAILEKCQVIHICGMKNYEKINSLKANKRLFAFKEFTERYKLYPYLSDELKDAYALSDIIISRAGANSLSEIIALEKPSVIIPLPTSANNHQLKNAGYFDERGMITLLKEENLTEDILTKELFRLLQEDYYKNNIIKKMKEFNRKRKNAAKIMAEEILNIKRKQ